MSPTNKELRLLKDILKQKHPKYRKYPRLLANDIHHQFFFKVPIERILNIKGFKQVLFKTIITKIRPIPNSNKYEVLTKKIRQNKK